MSPAHAQEQIADAVQAQGGEHGPVSLHKAWREMGHRYLAGTLGLLIFGIAVAAARAKHGSPVLPFALVVLVALQAALGMWTVTLLLKPVLVTLHLLGGMTTLALLAWLWARERGLAARELGLRTGLEPNAARILRPWAVLALAVVLLQIALG